jgi:hypothetical protein
VVNKFCIEKLIQNQFLKDPKDLLKEINFKSIFNVADSLKE